MDYTPYPGERATLELCAEYAELAGGWGKLVVGISCMEPGEHNFTTLSDARALAAFRPPGGPKGGAMLYTFNYDVKSRSGGGTGYPDGTWTETIRDYLLS